MVEKAAVVEKSTEVGAGFVYIVECAATESFKIGKSVNPVARVRSLQTANSNKLELRATIKTAKHGYP